LSQDTLVLLIDPETDLRAVIASRLATEGIGCLQADSLVEAWSILERETIQAVVSEMILPDGSGLELIKRLADRKKEIPIIYLTAYGGVEWAKKAIRSGAYDYYDKPTDMIKFCALVRKAVRSSANYAGVERRRFIGCTVERVDPASRDELTGLASHRFILEKLPVLHTQCRNQGIPLTLCLIDIDEFRKFNNQQGFNVGDQLLVEVGRRLRRIVRANDIVGRYGGDEFLLVLPGADQKAVAVLAERIKTNFLEEKWQMVSDHLQLPLCIGITEVDNEENADSLEFLDRTIEAVYHAKLQGPGAVVVWKPQLTQERLFNVDLDQDQSSDAKPDYESINIMMWRFRELNRRLSSVTLESLRLLVAAVEARDPYTKHHSVRVAGFARYLAEELDLPERQVRVVHSAALLHDIGKIGIPDAVLTKPSRLTPQETELIRQHPTIAANIHEQTRFFAVELPMVKHHHEWFNGNGYPDGIRGQDIPLGSRIIHVADAVEAMLARRSYKNACEIDYTIRQLREGSERQFDPIIANLAIRLIQDGALERLWKKRESADQELNLNFSRV